MTVSWQLNGHGEKWVFCLDLMSGLEALRFQELTTALLADGFQVWLRSCSVWQKGPAASKSEATPTGGALQPKAG